jgi:predicted nucleic acid-binding protein
LIDRILDSLGNMVVVDTDVMSYVFKHDTRAAFYEPHLAGKELIISFVTFAELQRWAIASKQLGLFKAAQACGVYEQGGCLSL